MLVQLIGSARLKAGAKVRALEMLMTRALQAAEKDPYASLRSIASLRRTVSTPPLVDFSRVLPLDLFEQPARGFSHRPPRRPWL